MAANPRFAKVAPSIVPKLDRFLSKVSGGRIMSSSAIVPSIVLVTTGARSGKQRETPLATIPLHGGFYVVGSNFAREAHPAWSYNLIAHPEATVVFKGDRIAVEAHLLEPAEKAAVWDELTALWPTYDTYEDRTERDLRVFELRPAAQQAE